jgi:hypothetical protein
MLGLVEEMSARIDDAGCAWGTSEDSEVLMLRATALVPPVIDFAVNL